MISRELLDILVCPEMRTSLSLADDQLVEDLNRAIAARALENLAGETLEESLSGALVREDGRRIYPIVDDIPILLVDQAIDAEQFKADKGSDGA